jgi:hypothetical protein
MKSDFFRRNKKKSSKIDRDKCQYNRDEQEVRKKRKFSQIEKAKTSLNIFCFCFWN